MRFLLDNHFPRSLRDHIRSLGHQCDRVGDVTFTGAKDLTLWDWCAQNAIVMVSRDADYVTFANRPKNTGRLLRVTIGNCKPRVLRDAFTRSHDEIIAAFNNGQRIFELKPSN